MPKGTMSAWYPERAFGFANNDGGGPSVFVHLSAFAENVQRDDVSPGMRIEFDLQPEPAHKTKAANIRFCR